MKYCMFVCVADASAENLKTPKKKKKEKRTTKAHTMIILTLDQFRRSRGISARTPGTYLKVNRFTNFDALYLRSCDFLGERR